MVWSDGAVSHVSPVHQPAAGPAAREGTKSMSASVVTLPRTGTVVVVRTKMCLMARRFPTISPVSVVSASAVPDGETTCWVVFVSVGVSEM